MKHNISRKKLLWMYEAMLKIRMFEEKIASLWHEQEMRSPPHFYTGQEAITVGVNATFRESDQIMGNYRGHGHYLAKGGNPEEFIAEMYCKITGSNQGKGGSMLISAPNVGYMGSSAIVGGGIPIATGLAFAAKIKKNKKVIAVFFGDAATEEGVFYESLNFAALHKLPILFICENNSYAVTTHISFRRSNPENIYKIVESFGIPSIKIDGNDIFKIYQTSENAVNRARNGLGPTFIECNTYRWHEHVGEKMDSETGLRTKKELENWIKKDPIVKFEKYLMNKKVLNKKLKEKIINDIEILIERSFKFGKESKLPSLKHLMENTYPTN